MPLNRHPETPPPPPVPGIQVHPMHVNDFEAPTAEQFSEFVALVDGARERGEGVAVHCRRVGFPAYNSNIRMFN